MEVLTYQIDTEASIKEVSEQVASVFECSFTIHDGDLYGERYRASIENAIIIEVQLNRDGEGYPVIESIASDTVLVRLGADNITEELESKMPLTKLTMKLIDRSSI